MRSHGADHGLGWAAQAIQKGPGGTFYVADAGLKQQILDLRFDPETASAMAGEFASDNGEYLSQHLGRQVDETDLSLAHFFGSAGALKFLTSMQQAPDASAAPYFGDAAAANPSIFYGPGGSPRSFAEIHARFARHASAGAPASPFATAATSPAAPQFVRNEATSSSSRSNDDAAWTNRMAMIEPMPDRLSLSFAQSAYRKLASMDVAR